MPVDEAQLRPVTQLIHLSLGNISNEKLLEIMIIGKKTKSA
jgi:hypothetical protein